MALAAEACIVALLGRDDGARQQLRKALQDLGAAVAFEAEPKGADAAVVLQHRPNVVIVNLAEGMDDDIDHLQSVFDAPGVNVVFNDADVSASLEGWDLARWARHLASKVLGHEDTMPPPPAGATRPGVASVTAVAPATVTEVARVVAPVEPVAEDPIALEPAAPDAELAAFGLVDEVMAEPEPRPAAAIESADHGSTNESASDFFFDRVDDAATQGAGLDVDVSSIEMAMAESLSQVPSETEKRKAVLRAWLARTTSYNLYRSFPAMLPYEALSPDDLVQGDTEFPIVTLAYGDVLLCSAHGHVLELPAVRPMSELIERLNSGHPIAVASLIETVVASARLDGHEAVFTIEADQIKSILESLCAMRAIVKNT